MTNAYEAGERRVIPAVLIYARHAGRVLMLHRGRPDDFHSGKWNGLGGKHEPGESPAQCARREFSEEAGLTIDPARFHWAGLLTFPDFKPNKREDWWVNVFTVELDASEAANALRESAEGRLEWIDDADVPKLNLWEGDAQFLPKVLGGETFQGTFWYTDGRLRTHELH